MLPCPPSPTPMVVITVVLRSVAVSNLHEDLLREELIDDNKHNLLNIPVAAVDEVLHVDLGLALKRIIKMVRGIFRPVLPVHGRLPSTVDRGSGKHLCILDHADFSSHAFSVTPVDRLRGSTKKLTIR